MSLAGAAFVGIFFFNVPFPIIIFGAALVGFAGAAMGVAAFQANSGHAPGKKGGDVFVDSLLGDQLPDHARLSLGRALKALPYGSPCGLRRSRSS